MSWTKTRCQKFTLRFIFQKGPYSKKRFIFQKKVHIPKRPQGWATRVQVGFEGGALWRSGWARDRVRGVEGSPLFQAPDHILVEWHWQFWWLLWSRCLLPIFKATDHTCKLCKEWKLICGCSNISGSAKVWMGKSIKIECLRMCQNR